MFHLCGFSSKCVGNVLDCLITKMYEVYSFLSFFLSLFFVWGGGGIILLSLFFHLFLASICFVLNLYYISCLFHVH